MKRLTPMNKLFIGITSFLFVFIAGTRTAQAFIHPDIVNLLVGWIVGFVVGIINTVIGIIAWVFFLIAGWLIDFGLSINSQLANSALIKTGYDIVLSIANLGIIIAIVVIAFMIMLRRSNASQLLVRFILVAILMNFGLVIVINLLIKPVDEITGIIHDATQFGPTSFGKAFYSLGYL